MHRREFLEKAGILAASATVTAISGCEAPKPSKVYPSRDLIYQAATIELSTSTGLGHGALMWSNQGYYIYTIGHTADMLKERPNSAVATFPGIRTTRIDPNNLIEVSHTSTEFDYSSVYFLNPELTQMVQDAIARRLITYLIPSTKSITNSESVAIPNYHAHAYTESYFDGYSPSMNIAYLQQVDGQLLCEGTSGSPILRLDNRTITNEVYGLLSAGEGLTPRLVRDTNQIVECSSRILYRPYP